MKNVKTMVKAKKSNIDLENSFYESLKDPDFNEVISSLKLDNKVLENYTSRLEDSTEEFKNCKKCKGLDFCKNELNGYVYTPENVNAKLIFSYKPCKFKIRDLEKNKYKFNINLFDMPFDLKNARMKDIYLDEKSRIEAIEYIAKYFKKYFSDRQKGLYLYGNFGCGKTYIIAALFNEFAKKDVKSAIIYFPEFLRTLKASFKPKETNNEVSFSQKYEYIKKIPLLLIDDIGAENISAWARDEILGTLLQYRMEQKLPTFFTSNLSLAELEEHLAMTSRNVEKVKARRIIERIKYLTNETKIIGANRR